MKLFIDDLDIEKVKELWDLYPVDGVTSNPTILSKTGRQPLEVLKEIREFIGSNKTLMTQVVSTNAEGMIAEAKVITDAIGKENTYVKVPANPQGLKAIKTLKKEGYQICATGIYTVAQGFLAAQAGADLVAPYINRIDNLGGDGIQVAKDIQDILNAYHLPTGISSASFKTTKQVIELAKYGIEAAAINVEVWEAFMKNEVVDAAIDKFNSDFEGLVGKNKTFLDL
ncbi:MAG: transaldolase family protein [Anaerostipes sp.]|jgi:TalC/MipB family fructose-6-phosphate aldolase|nr:transaldolase family protein [Anaerostipes sp.]MDD3746405.1 transaldolase family protein [Anaerostipes sp.]